MLTQQQVSGLQVLVTEAYALEYVCYGSRSTLQS